MPRETRDLLFQTSEIFSGEIFRRRGRAAAEKKAGVRREGFFTKSLLLTFLCGTACLGIAICGLRQWHSAAPWSQLDIFSGGVMALATVWCLATAYFHRRMFQSREIMIEASGVTFDRLMFLWIDLFAAGEVLIFFEYGQWHLVPQLRQPFLQIPGLALCVAGLAWLIWTDIYLSRQFHDGLNKRKMMDRGPYRFVRHPRYAGLIVCSVAIALTMASAIAWLLAIGWIFVNVRRVDLEEGHLRQLFGKEYDRYAAHTARFVPGVY